jgi:hypothetical protein
MPGTVIALGSRVPKIIIALELSALLISVQKFRLRVIICSGFTGKTRIA